VPGAKDRVRRRVEELCATADPLDEHARRRERPKLVRLARRPPQAAHRRDAVLRAEHRAVRARGGGARSFVGVAFFIWVDTFKIALVAQFWERSNRRV
jgi:hypothetical protein